MKQPIEDTMWHSHNGFVYDHRSNPVCDCNMSTPGRSSSMAEKISRYPHIIQALRRLVNTVSEEEAGFARIQARQELRNIGEL